MAESFQRLLPLFGVKVFTLRTDRGTEFLGEAFRAMLAKHEIKLILGASHVPQSNGAAEAGNRSILQLMTSFKTRTARRRGRRRNTSALYAKLAQCTITQLTA